MTSATLVPMSFRVSAFSLAALALWAAAARAGAEPGSTSAEVCIRAHREAQLDQQSHALIRAEQSALRCAQSDCPAALRSDCVALHEMLARSVPSVVFVVRTADGHDLPGAHVELGDALAFTGLDGRAHAVDPGVYSLRVRAEGFEPYVGEVVVHTAERERVLHVELAPRVREAPRSPEGLPSPSPARLGWALGGVGAVALAVGAGFGLRGLMQKQCADACSDGEASAIRRNLLAADVLAPLGGALLISGLLVQLWPRAHGPREASVRPSLAAGPAGVFVVGHGAF
jgi:hypothetical protein